MKRLSTEKVILQEIMPNFFLTFFIISMMFCCSMVNATSSMQPWTSQVPNALQPIQNNQKSLINLVNDGVLIYPQPKKIVKIDLHTKILKRPATFISSAVIINAKPAEVKRVLSDYQQYPKLFPKLVSAKILQQSGNLAKVKYRAVINIPVPILKFDENFIFRHQIQGNTLSTWIEDSPVKYGMGQFQWHAISSGKHAGKTLLTLTQWGDLDNLRGFILPRIMRAMPVLKIGIPNNINAYVMEALRLHFNGTDKVATYAHKSILPAWDNKVKANQKIVNQLLKNTQVFPVTFAYPPRKLKSETTLRFVSSIQNMPAKQDKVNKWLLQPKNYPKMISHVKKVTAKKHLKYGKQGELITTDIKIGLGVLSIPFQTKLFFHYPDVNQAVFSSHGGDVRWVEGKFQTIPKNSNSSLLLTTLASKTDKNAPFLLRMSHEFPYHDYLSSVGVAPVLSYKVKTKL